MTYTFSQDLPFTEDVFRRYRAAVPDDAPPGFIARIAFEVDDGVRMLEVWESEEDRARFIAESVSPVVQDAFFEQTGYRPPEEEPPRNEIKVLDVWTTGRFRLDI